MREPWNPEIGDDELDTHHLLAQSEGGLDIDSNRLRDKKLDHIAQHMVFDTLHGGNRIKLMLMCVIANQYRYRLGFEKRFVIAFQRKDKDNARIVLPTRPPMVFDLQITNRKEQAFLYKFRNCKKDPGEFCNELNRWIDPRIFCSPYSKAKA